MKNEWRLVIGITIIIVIISFAILNGDSVPISYGFGEVSAPLIIVMVISLLLGSILTLIVSSSSVRHGKKELKSLREKVDNQEFQTEEAVKRANKEYEMRIQELEATIAQKDTVIQQYESEKQTKTYNDFKQDV
ncbi:MULTISPECIES: LapA family protein [unclassified Jeotgalibaca]|uniref:LapA family protein n=1 Tax=unclassified Jeotgalibaca TaxID=2621505 RepID=UPI003FD299AF